MPIGDLSELKARNYTVIGNNDSNKRVPMREPVMTITEQIKPEKGFEETKIDVKPGFLQAQILEAQAKMKKVPLKPVYPPPSFASLIEDKPVKKVAAINQVFNQNSKRQSILTTN